MPELHDVVQGECIDSIAFEKKVTADLIWNDGANAALKTTRKDRNVLLPGDTVTIPDKRLGWFDAKQTEHTHVFRLRDRSIEYRVEVVLAGELVADAACEVTIDGASVPVVSAGGVSTCKIQPNAKRAVIRIKDRDPGADDGVAEYTVELGQLDPLREDSGKRQRLQNTGYLRPPDVTELNDGLRYFQPVHSIAPADPTPDQRTKIAEPVLDLAASIPALKTLTGDKAT